MPSRISHAYDMSIYIYIYCHTCKHRLFCSILIQYSTLYLHSIPSYAALFYPTVDMSMYVYASMYIYCALHIQIYLYILITTSVHRTISFTTLCRTSFLISSHMAVLVLTNMADVLPGEEKIV